ADAFILESLSSGVRAAAFMVPAAIGVQEGGLVLFGTLFGLPAEIGLVISLSKRVRELLLGLPGLFFWYWLEARYLLRRSGGWGRLPMRSSASPLAQLHRAQWRGSRRRRAIQALHAVWRAVSGNSSNARTCRNR